MIEQSYWIPALPLLGAALVGAFGPRLLRDRAHWPVILGVAGAAVLSLVLLVGIVGEAGTAHGGDEAGAHAAPVGEAHRTEGPSQSTHTVRLYDWFPTGRQDLPETPEVDEGWFGVTFLIDPLTAVMLVVVTVVSTLVVIYSRDYMREHGQPERGYERFFAFLGLFVFSMCVLVLAGNFLLLYLGWEAVGLCSYLLIGFYYGRPSAAEAAKKAFLVNRIGDFGFGLGVLLIFLTFGTLDYEPVFAAVRAALAGDAAGVGAALHIADAAEAAARADLIVSRLTPIALLLFCGAVGKSAQLPLYVWLPDAMEGPTPVSALIHAATMVTAGVYMVARCGVIFAGSETALTVVAVVGGLTALFSATIALAQYDMKRILAYSTISQLGYMFLGLGAFAADAAIFHLYTHAFFKACLFLTAGSVMHAMGGIIDVREFSGLRRIMPVTCWTTILGGLALAGFPLVSGFWSKDEIIHAAIMHRPWLGWLALVTAVLTAFYTFRMVYLAFFGEQRVPAGVHAHESGPWMLVPVSLLALGAVFAGYVGVEVQPGGFLGIFAPHGAFHHLLAGTQAPFAEAAPIHEEAGGYGLMYVSAILSAGAIAVAWWLYAARRDIPAAVARTFPRAYGLLAGKYYVDEIYDATIVQPVWGLARFCGNFDVYIIDGLVWVATVIPHAVGHIYRTLQRGALQGYAVGMVIGLAILVWFVILSGA